MRDRTYNVWIGQATGGHRLTKGFTEVFTLGPELHNTHSKFQFGLNNRCVNISYGTIH